MQNIQINSDGICSEAKFIASPNIDARPNAEDISLIVIHNISLPPKQYGGNGVIDLFSNQLNPDDHPYFKEIYQLKVSAHLVIKRDGSCVQYVPFNKRAWHAGASNYQGREGCNDFSIGIELEGSETIAYTDAQYQKLNKILTLLIEYYPKLSKQDITGHSDIAPSRKTDPGATFDWQRIK